MPKITADRAKTTRRDKLRALRTRLGITQAQLGRRAKMTQSEISRVELRSDCLVSTLQRYAAALDGELEIAVRVAGRSHPVVLG